MNKNVALESNFHISFPNRMGSQILWFLAIDREVLVWNLLNAVLIRFAAVSPDNSEGWPKSEPFFGCVKSSSLAVAL